MKDGPTDLVLYNLVRFCIKIILEPWRSFLWNGSVSSGKPISTFEILIENLFFQSRVSRWKQEFVLSFNLIHWDVNENLFLSVSCFAMRTRIKIKKILVSIVENETFACFGTDIFKKLLISKLFLIRTVCTFFSRNFNENQIFKDENKKIFLSI